MKDKEEKWWRKHYESTQQDDNEKEGKLKREEEQKLTNWIRETIEKYVQRICLSRRVVPWVQPFFLDAATHLCKRVCPSVRRSVGP